VLYLLVAAGWLQVAAGRLQDGYEVRSALDNVHTAACGDWYERRNRGLLFAMAWRHTCLEGETLQGTTHVH